MALLQRNTEQIEIQCTVEFNTTKTVLSLSCNCIDECQYSISDQQGQILSKGLFTACIDLPLTTLQPGFYNLIVFNSLYRKVIPFKL
jgi:hypothetical protein